MQISSKLEVEGNRIVSEIGRISAASAWHNKTASADFYREGALEKLKRLAQEFEADAIVGVDFSTDEVEENDLAPLPLNRISVSGVAVKLSRG